MPTTDPITITVSERKAAERARRLRAAGEIVARMRDYAARSGGRFVVFGSYAAGRMGHDSDLDVMVDVPEAGRPAAWTFLEGLAVEYNLVLDLFDRNTTKPAFVARVEAAGLHLP